MTELRNASDLVFKDVSSEKQREYRFPDGAVVTIREPTHLSVSASGGHRLLDAAGTSHYIPGGWIHLQWQVKGNEPHFNF